MTVHRLVEPPGSRCFVCASGNHAGLRIPFDYDDATAMVHADVTFDERHCGAPTYVHVGLTVAVLNEAMAWVVVAATGRFAVTSESGARFVRPLRVGLGYHVRARVDEVTAAVIRGSALVVDTDERPCAEATAAFRALSGAAAARLRARVSDPSRPRQVGRAGGARSVEPVEPVEPVLDR